MDAARPARFRHEILLGLVAFSLATIGLASGCLSGRAGEPDRASEAGIRLRGEDPSTGGARIEIAPASGLATSVDPVQIEVRPADVSAASASVPSRKFTLPPGARLDLSRLVPGRYRVAAFQDLDGSLEPSAGDALAGLHAAEFDPGGDRPFVVAAGATTEVALRLLAPIRKRSPEPGAGGVGGFPRFVWEPLRDAALYRLEVLDAGAVIFSVETSGTEVPYGESVPPGATLGVPPHPLRATAFYDWRVTAYARSDAAPIGFAARTRFRY